MDKLDWTPVIFGTVPADVMANPERAKVEAAFDRDKLKNMPVHLVIDVLLDRIERLERLERMIFPLD